MDILKEYKKALKKFEEAIETGTQHGDAFFQKGMCLKELGTRIYRKKAQKAFEDAIATESTGEEGKRNEDLLWRAYNSKGLILLERKKYGEAIRSFDEAKKLLPKFNNQPRRLVLTNQAEAYRRNGNYALDKRETYNEAIENYDNAIELNPRDTGAYRGKGAALYRQGNYEEAIRCYEEAIRLNNQDSAAYRGKGDALSTQEEYADAIACYDETLRLNPEDRSAYKNKANALRRQGYHEIATNVDRKYILSCIGTNKLTKALRSVRKLDIAARAFDEVRKWMPVNTLEEEKHQRVFQQLSRVIGDTKRRNLLRKTRIALTKSCVRLFNWLVQAGERMHCAVETAKAVAMIFREISEPRESIQFLVDVPELEFWSD